MPELPEVEVVRRGVAEHVVGRRIERAEILGARVARRHEAGPAALGAALTGVRVQAARRRGKYLWMDLDDGEALVVHLGMSGQLLVEEPDAPREKHCHAMFDLDDERQLRFVDQRTFGGLQLVALAQDEHSDALIPTVIRHIAPDPLEPVFDVRGTVRRMRRKHTQIKRALLDQTLVSGIGNIYADEALWRTKLHGERLTDKVTAATSTELLGHATQVMREALGQGGTSFDSLYVNVNGASGYFDRSLNAYGRAGRECRRCGALMVRENFMNRGSFSCPVCQPRPRIVRS
ncbi:bifunctional DNA-formamidopyrimidine glycosylase/DNA-(apurinic or apyrimidinic site) lyase [Yimella sp. cx-51]|uniref:bifunctional DNA-formamidopyrimidine glycosylase/DNA-(apurinic or apyrimidinic site) lyase n=1 Tax=Yimella sp. cx-51 TaxID=2770551 RepID=UPI00165D3321|nr:bifunctional DNA-formamidopyrimidine glycosylase/DNA-(apurinic or apyrimidinic site) lyase [Yimella sp. cx-51]MBC9956735.1 bifunctional DNA-formamidopyrimidine glycosylase/DNA-(apurinic or apyrimidinic site) lyase [Yimella sp. cx-51]QTH38971.1 bifunctional DNA-formamidopyrimidine glycosylase/DNA-(apurinic or apyrimidinic site) lyase [Yimella sp. cx-51]